MAAATNSWDSFAGGFVGGLCGAAVGGGIVDAYSQQFANYRAGNGFRSNADVRIEQRHLENMKAALGMTKEEITLSQRSIDYVVGKYDLDTYDMLGQMPVYNKYQGWEGATDRATRLVSIGPPAFKSEGYLAAVIGHEGVHATQWTTPNWARTMTQPMREMQASQWMLDNATRLYNTPAEIKSFQAYYDGWTTRSFDYN